EARGAERPPVFAPAEAAPVLAPPLATTLPPSDPAPAVEVPPQRERTKASLATAGSLRLRRLVAATGVEAHEPTGASDSFEGGAPDRLYAFIEAVNESDAPGQLYVTFEPDRGETTGH